MDEKFFDFEGMTDTQLKAYVDYASFEELFECIRFAPAGCRLFQGEIGDYCLERFHKLKKILETIDCKYGGAMRGCELCYHRFICWSEDRPPQYNIPAGVSKKLGWNR